MSDWKHCSGSELQLEKVMQFCALQVSLTFLVSGRTLTVITSSAASDRMADTFMMTTSNNKRLILRTWFSALQVAQDH